MPGDTMPTKHWSSQQLWTRVPSPVRHDPDAFRIYAADEDILDVISGDANTAAHDVWWNEHINDVDAAAAIKTALAAIRAGEEQLDEAVLRARQKRLSWAKIGAAAEMSAQAAHERWAKRAAGASSLEGLLELKPRALLVGRDDPRGVIPSVPGDFSPTPGVSDAPLSEAVSPTWKALGSGGSTGRPKLIEAGGDSRFPGALVGLGMGGKEGDTQLIAVPLSHNTGMTTATIGLLLRNHLVLMPRFDDAEFLRLVAEHRVDFIVAVPTIMQRLLPVYRANPDAYDLSSVRRLWHVGAACPPAVKQAWIELLGPDVVWELYGGTELQAITVLSGTQWLEHPGSVGVVVAGEMKVLDDDGNECPPGVVGEIYMRP
jgi:non-ribosomal peptide synthetase component F